jgi:uncharacterized protein (DUF4415 family)
VRRRGDIVRYTAEEIDEMLRRGEDRTDWAKVDAMTEEELEASIAADPDDTHEEPDWSQAIMGLPPLPPARKHISLRLDADVLDWFKATGKDYRARINDVLRAYVESCKKAAE